MGIQVNLTDSELVCLLNKGDQDAFMEIYRRYKRPLTMNLLRVLKDPDLVEEVLQDLFLTIWEKRSQIDASQSIAGYLYRAAVNRSKNIFRRMAYDQQMRNAVFAKIEENHTNAVEDWMDEKEIKQLLDDLLNRLPPQQQKVYRLCKLEGMSYKEVSQALSISETTVNTHIRNANRFLRGEIDRIIDPASVFHLLILLWIIF